MGSFGVIMHKKRHENAVQREHRHIPVLLLLHGPGLDTHRLGLGASIRRARIPLPLPVIVDT